MVKPSLCSPVLCTSIVLFGSGRGISVSVNSAAGISPSVLPPRSTTTPCSVYATTLTSITSCDAAASCFSSYSCSNLLISSEPAASSSAAADSASAACASWVASDLACAAATFVDAPVCSGVPAAGVSRSALAASEDSAAAAGAICSVAFSTGEFVSVCVLFGAVSASGAGAAAAALEWLSYSVNMVVGLRKFASLWVAAMRPRVQSNEFLADSLSGFSARRLTANRLLGTQMLRASKTLQPQKETRGLKVVSINLRLSKRPSILQLFQQFPSARLHGR